MSEHEGTLRLKAQQPNGTLRIKAAEDGGVTLDVKDASGWPASQVYMDRDTAFTVARTILRIVAPAEGAIVALLPRDTVEPDR